VQMKVGLEHGTFANYREAVKSMWNETVIPMYDRIGDDLTRGLDGDSEEEEEQQEDSSFTIGFDYGKVDALQEDQDKRRTFSITAYDKGMLTLNEAREFAGFEAIKDEEGDERKAHRRRSSLPRTRTRRRNRSSSRSRRSRRWTGGTSSQKPRGCLSSRVALARS